MKRYVFILLLTVFLNNCFAGTVVFLHGTGCAGKTGLCKELVKQSNDWKLVSEDDYYYEKAVMRWKNEFPHEFKTIEKAVDNENILHAIMRSQVLFRADASEWERKKAQLAISVIQEELNSRPKDKERDDPNSWHNLLRKQITQTIIDLAKTHHVIVDTWFLQEEHINEISEQHEVIHVLAYCPFGDIIQRTLKRNYDALMSGTTIWNLRFFHQGLKSFTGLYDLSDVKDGSVDELKKESVIHGCDLVRLCLEDSPNATGATKLFTRGEFSVQEFEEFRKNVLAQFEGEVAYVHSKCEIDAVIRTDQGAPAECARVIRELVNKK